MGKVLLRIVLILLAIVAGFTAIGYLLPRDYSVTTSVTIEGPVEEAFRRVDTTEEWTDWSPWMPSRIENLTLDYEGPKSGEGAIMKWKDPRPDGRFDGQMKIIGSEKNRRIEISCKSGEIPMNGHFDFEEKDGKTIVTWTAAGELPSGAMYGWLAMTYYEGYLENEMSTALTRLKNEVEGKAAE